MMMKSSFYLIFALSMLQSFFASELRGGSGEASSTCFCTTVPCPVAGDNSLTEGGGGVGVYTYTLHNNYPVVKSAKVTITAANLDMGTDTTTCTQNYARSLDDDGVQDCDAGHILAHRLGGPGNQPTNIFPQDLSINRGVYAQFEGVIYDCIKTQGATSGDLSWSFVYESETRSKPQGVTYTAVFHGGSCGTKSQTFTNGN